MQVVAKFNINANLILDNRGLNEGGIVQKTIDSECIRLMDDYTPNLNGQLIASLRLNTIIGSGKLVQATPYARYLYYGELYVDPVTGKGCYYDPKTGRKWSHPNREKVPSGRPLKYSQVKSPKAGSHWFTRMVSDHGDDIGRAAAKAAGGIFEK